MKYLEEILPEITELAKLASYTPHMIAEVVMIDPAEFLQTIMTDKQHPLTIAYLTGKRLMEAEYNKKVSSLSTQGSGPAQAMLHQMNKEQEFKTFREYYG